MLALQKICIQENERCRFIFIADLFHHSTYVKRFRHWRPCHERSSRATFTRGDRWIVYLTRVGPLRTRSQPAARLLPPCRNRHFLASGSRERPTDLDHPTIIRAREIPTWPRSRYSRKRLLAVAKTPFSARTMAPPRCVRLLKKQGWPWGGLITISHPKQRFSRPSCSPPLKQLTWGYCKNIQAGMRQNTCWKNWRNNPNLTTISNRIVGVYRGPSSGTLHGCFQRVSASAILA